MISKNIPLLTLFCTNIQSRPLENLIFLINNFQLLGEFSRKTIHFLNPVSKLVMFLEGKKHDLVYGL